MFLGSIMWIISIVSRLFALFFFLLHQLFFLPSNYFHCFYPELLFAIIFVLYIFYYTPKLFHQSIICIIFILWYYVLLFSFFCIIQSRIIGPFQFPRVDKPHPAARNASSRLAVAGSARKDVAQVIWNGSCMADWDNRKFPRIPWMGIK